MTPLSKRRFAALRGSQIACACLLLAACGDDGAETRASPLWSDGAHLRDQAGRVALLRGVNARVDGVFDVTFDDGRVALEPIPPLTAADCTRMRELGFDLLRLPINWSGVEPAPGAYDDAYLARVDAAIACAADAGLFVIVDLHQDAYSKEIGEDGAPLWAIQPPPTELLEGPLDDLAARRVSPQVQAAFHTFFAPDDAAGLQAAFSAMIGHVAARYADHPAVIGFELFNEPDTGTVELDAFHRRAGQAVRDAAPRKLVFFEPPALRNFTDFIPRPREPFPIPGAVYSPHIYTYVFQSDTRAFESATFEDLEASVRAAREEASAFGTPLFVGEYGVAPVDAEANNRWMRSQAQLHDRYYASSAFWLWKEQSQGRWGVFDVDDATGVWTERPLVVGWLSRVRVARIAGTPATLESSAAGDAVRLELQPGSALDVPHVVYIPERFATATSVRCDGAEIIAPRDPVMGTLEISCTGVLEVGPR
jgi:endoglycosylceramidase